MRRLSRSKLIRFRLMIESNERPNASSCRGLLAKDFYKPFDDLRNIRRRDAAQPFADPLHRQGSNLTDFHPSGFTKFRYLQCQRQRKPSFLHLAGQRDRDDGAGSGIEDIVAEDEHWTVTRMLMAVDGI